MSFLSEAPFDVVVNVLADEVTLAVSGEVDIATVYELGAAIDNALLEGLPLTLDLTATGFMDSSGVAVLIRTHRKSEDLGVPLTIRTSPGLVRKVLVLSGITQRLVVDPEATGIAADPSSRPPPP